MHSSSYPSKSMFEVVQMGRWDKQRRYIETVEIHCLLYVPVLYVAVIISYVKGLPNSRDYTADVKSLKTMKKQSHHSLLSPPNPPLTASLYIQHRVKQRWPWGDSTHDQIYIMSAGKHLHHIMVKLAIDRKDNTKTLMNLMSVSQRLVQIKIIKTPPTFL